MQIQKKLVLNKQTFFIFLTCCELSHCRYTSSKKLFITTVWCWCYLWRPIVCMRDIGPRKSVLRGGWGVIFLREPNPYLRKVKKTQKIRTVLPTDAIGFELSTACLPALRAESISHWGSYSRSKKSNYLKCWYNSPITIRQTLKSPSI